MAHGADRHLELSWLHRRLELFQEWCLPSVLGQSDTDFNWVIAIDARVNGSFCKKLEKVLPEQAELRFWNSEVRKSWCRPPSEGSRPIATCRLDSDDAIHKHFVRAVRSFGEDGYVLNFMRGVRIDLIKLRVAPIWDASGPFVSFVSSQGQAVSVLGRHADVSRHVPVINLETASPMWLQTVSGTNILNSVKWFYPPAQTARIAEDFSLPAKAMTRVLDATPDKSAVYKFFALVPRLVLRLRQVTRARKIGRYRREEGLF